MFLFLVGFGRSRGRSVRSALHIKLYSPTLAGIAIGKLPRIFPPADIELLPPTSHNPLVVSPLAWHHRGSLNRRFFSFVAPDALSVSDIKVSILPATSRVEIDTMLYLQWLTSAPVGASFLADLIFTTTIMTILYRNRRSEPRQ